MSWFSRKARTPTTETLQALILDSELQAGGRVGRSYDSYAKLGYRGTVAAFRAINDISSSASSVPFEVFVGGEKQTEHPLVTLLKEPAPRRSMRSMMREVYAWYKLSGNAYIRAMSGPSNTLVGLKMLHAHEVTEVKRMGPTRVMYKLGPFDAPLIVDDLADISPLMHKRTFNPTQDALVGVPPLEPASVAIDRHRHSDEWNYRLMVNGAKPSGGFFVKLDKDSDASLSAEQRELLKEQVREVFTGAENAGRPFIGEGGLEWQQFGLSPVDADWLNGKNAAARDIANALGYPPMLLALPGDNTFSNQREARLALWEETIIPLVLEFAEEMGNWLAPYYGFRPGQLELRPKFDAVSALALKRERIWERVKNSPFLSVNDARSEVGLDEREEPEADEVMTLAQMVPLRFAAIPRTEDDLRNRMAIQRGESQPGSSTDEGADPAAVEPPTPEAPADTEAPPEGVETSQVELPNGAQVVAMLDVLERVSSGALPKPSAQIILETAFGLESSRAAAILAPIEPAPPAAPPATNQPPREDETGDPDAEGASEDSAGVV